MSRLLRQQAPRFLHTACRLPETVLSVNCLQRRWVQRHCFTMVLLQTMLPVMTLFMTVLGVMTLPVTVRGMTVLSVMALSATMQFKIVRLTMTLSANARL